MNLILFHPDELAVPLPRSDPRARHVLEVLRREVGNTFDVGEINGPRGKATLAAVDDAALTLSFEWGEPPPAMEPITLIVGLPRPQTARDILRDATSLGATAIHFVKTERGEPSYAQSTLWSSGEWRRLLITGAEQAFDTRIPEVTHGGTLEEAFARLVPDDTRVALDNYEATHQLGEWAIFPNQPVALAFGAERGWSETERETLRAHSFGLAHLGPRVLRTETAVIAALAVVRTKLRLM